ncbi:MAG TPA: Ig-like domain-containing protein, partial [Spirochaetota bacterium]|nr:Ig-like domain-containing protein [Spirochaetota bacterium]
MKKVFILLIALTFLCSNLTYSQTNDNTVDSSKKKTTVKNKIEDEKNVEKAKRKEIVDKLKNEKKEILKKIKLLNEELKKNKKDIQTLTDRLIASIKSDETEKLKEKKSELLLKKSDLTNKVALHNKRIAAVDLEINKKEDGFVTADGTINWNKTFDIKKYEKSQYGTWSVSVVAKDDMNNLSKEEAINIKIDPKSDIPILNIINPRLNARIPGNLMVVGTAFDDDGIEKVEMFLNGDKTSRICVGKDFWYYDLDTSEMKDGIHNLRFKVYDI